MIFGFLLSRLNQRNQENTMTCKTHCTNCKCKKPCGTLDRNDDLYTEIDDSSFAPRSLYQGLK